MREGRHWDGTRVRIQRLYDAKYFGGWVISASPPVVAVRMGDPGDLGPGDECVLQIYGQAPVVFHAQCLTSQKGSASFEMTSQPIEVPVSEQVRVAVHGLLALCFVSRKMHRVEVLDLGQGGVAMLFDREVMTGQDVMVELETDEGRVRLIGETRYCRPERGTLGYRVGLKITSMDAESREVWDRVFDRVA